VRSRRDRLLLADRGSAVVEFALVLPLLLLVVLAVVQVGLLGRDQLLVSQSSRAGAREAAVDPDDRGVRLAAVEAAPGLDPERLTVEVQRAGAMGQPVSVSVAYRATISVPLAGWLFPSEVGLRATATMRQEFP